MARADITIRLSGLERYRLFVWELRMLEDEMRMMASPHHERLSALINRFTVPDDKDDGPADG